MRALVVHHVGVSRLFWCSGYGSSHRDYFISERPVLLHGVKLAMRELAYEAIAEQHEFGDNVHRTRDG